MKNIIFSFRKKILTALF